MKDNEKSIECQLITNCRRYDGNRSHHLETIIIIINEYKNSG